MARGREVWVDWEDIPPSAEWWAEIEGAITAAEAFVFVISPASADSEVCERELLHAMGQGKRLIPVLHEDVPEGSLPDPLSVRNWVFLRGSDPFDSGVEQLVEALDTDLDWVHRHTRLLVRATEWEDRGEDGSLLLRGSDLGAAERFLAEATDKEPPPTPLQTRFVLSSRRAATSRQRRTIVAVSAAFAVAVLLAVFALIQRQDAIHQAHLALSREFADEALQQLTGDPSLALKLAVQAGKESLTPEARNALLRSLEADHELGRDTTRQAPLHSWQLAQPSLTETWSPDGRLVLIGGGDGRASTHEVANGSVVRVFGSSPPNTNAYAGFSSGDHRIVMVAVTRLYSSKTGLLTAYRATGSVWNADSGAHVDSPPVGVTQDTGPLATPVFDAESGRSDFATVDGRSVRLWNADTGKGGAALPLSGTGIESVTLSPRGGVVAVGGSDGTVRIWTPPSAKGVRVVHVASAPVVHIAFTANGARLVAAATDGTVRVVDVPSGRVHAPLKGPGSSLDAVEFSPDGRFVAAKESDPGRRLWVWDVGTGLRVPGFPIGQIGPHFSSGVPFGGVSFSPDSRWLAVGTSGNDVPVFDLITGTIVANVRRPVVSDLVGQGAHGVAFEPGGSHDLLVAWNTGLVEVAGCRLCSTPDELLTFAEGQVHGALTVAECERFLHTSTCPS